MSRTAAHGTHLSPADVRGDQLAEVLDGRLHARGDEEGGEGRGVHDAHHHRERQPEGHEDAPGSSHDVIDVPALVGQGRRGISLDRIGTYIQKSAHSLGYLRVVRPKNVHGRRW